MVKTRGEGPVMWREVKWVAMTCWVTSMGCLWFDQDVPAMAALFAAQVWLTGFFVLVCWRRLVRCRHGNARS
jgi:hypothetical protein